MRRIRLPWLAAVPAALFTLTACDEERAITREPVGARAYGASIVPSPFFNFPRATVAFGTAALNETITINNLAGLDSLDGAVYTVWGANADGTNIKPLVGTLTPVRTDTTRNAFGDDVQTNVTLDARTGVSSFGLGGPNIRFTFAATRSASGLTEADTVAQLLISIESASGATAPSTNRVSMWAVRPAGGTGTLVFGNWEPVAADRYVFPRVGRGRLDVRGDVFVVNDTLLGRPPRGYYYAGFLVRRDTLNQPIDFIDLGPMTTPFPSRQSLFDADVSIVDPQYVFDNPFSIAAGAWRFEWSQVPADIRGRDLGASRVPSDRRDRPWVGFEEFVITVQSKDAREGIPSPSILLRAGVPGVVSGI